MTGHVAEPPVSEAGHLFQQIGFDIDHPVAPAALGGGFAGMNLVRVHGDDGFMGVRLKGVVRNMRVIQLQAR